MFSVDWLSAEPVWSANGNIIAVWVFGSAQEGQVKSGSDVDIATLFKVSPSLDELADLRADLQQALGFDDIDLTILNSASPITRFEAVSGRLLYCRDRSALAGFASLSAREYEDSMAFLQWGLAQRTP